MRVGWPGALTGEGVTVLGRVSDAELDALYRGALALVMPSLLEGYGLPVREALARGTPAVISDLPVFGSRARRRGAPRRARRRAGAHRGAAAPGARGGPARRARRRRAGRAVAGLSWDEAARRTRAVLAAAAGRGSGGDLRRHPQLERPAWLPGCLAALAAQERAADEVIVVDNGSRDGSLEYLRDEHPEVRVVALSDNTGFAHAANLGLHVAAGDVVALVNADVELAPDWLARTAAVLDAHPSAASWPARCSRCTTRGSSTTPATCCAATASVSSAGASDPTTAAGTCPARCSAPAPARPCTAGPPSSTAGGFHEPYFAYVEDVDLALRLRLAGWTCRYEPAVALHAAQSASEALPGGAAVLATRNTLILIARFWPARWLGLVLYRQLGWAWHAARERRLRAHLRALAAARPDAPGRAP